MEFRFLTVQTRLVGGAGGGLSTFSSLPFGSAEKIHNSNSYVSNNGNTVEPPSRPPTLFPRISALTFGHNTPLAHLP